MRVPQILVITILLRKHWDPIVLTVNRSSPSSITTVFYIKTTEDLCRQFELSLMDFQGNLMFGYPYKECLKIIILKQR